MRWLKDLVKAIMGPVCRRILAKEIYLLEKQTRAFRSEAEQYRTALAERQEELNRLVPLLTQWVDCWREYLHRRSAELPGLMATVTAQMDRQSVQLAHQLVMLYECLVPRLNDFRRARFDREIVYTADDLALKQKIEQRQCPACESFRFPDGLTVERDALCLGFGLKFFPEHVRKTLRWRDVIDGGAYVGDSALSFRESGARRIYSFEPDKRNYEALIDTIVLNQARGVIVPIHQALGRERGQARLYCCDSAGINMGASVKEDLRTGRPWGSYYVDVVDIDSFVREHGVDVGLIKLDVEGAEYDAICGAMRTIRKKAPLLIVSLYHNPRDFFEIRPLIDRILPNFYHFEIRRCGFVNPVTDIILVGYPARHEQHSDEGVRDGADEGMCY